MTNEQKIAFVNTLLKNGLEERVIHALEHVPEFTPSYVKALNDARIPKSGSVGWRRTEEEVFRAVDEMARNGQKVSLFWLSKHLGMSGSSMATRGKNNPQFAERLKAKIASVNAAKNGSAE